MKKFIALILSASCIFSLFTAYADNKKYQLDTASHYKYMDGRGDGSFDPDGYVTRAETAQMIYNLLTEKPSASKTFSDTQNGEWYCTAINALYSAGIIGSKYDAFFPDAYMSRAEMAEIICYFSEESKSASSFEDVPADHEFFKSVCTAAANGWIKGFPDNKFYPDNPITRAEAAVLMNRVLDRHADAEYIAQNDRVRVFTDVEPSHWAYLDITEATVQHSHIFDNGEKWTAYSWEKTGLEPGYHMINHYLYYVEEETGQFSINCSRDGFSFDSRGRYTSGNTELDGYLHEVIKNVCINEPASMQNLEAIYFYVRDNFQYQARALVKNGATGWEMSYAVPMMKSHYGNCYSWAAVFMYLTRSAGFDSVCLSGKVGRSQNDHGWTEIRLNGAWYVFDPELEHSSRKNGNKNFHKKYFMLPLNTKVNNYTRF